MLDYEKRLYPLMLIVIACIGALGLWSDGLSASLGGLWALQTAPARLINDYTAIAGHGAALLNAALMGALALGLVALSGVRLSGPTVAGVFTIIGFSLFGKTPVNAAPIVAGVFVASRVARKPFKNYLLMALFGTALGPLVSFAAFEAGLGPGGGAALGLGFGFVAGFLLPGLAMAMLRMHEGFNLYNIGLTCGFLGLFLASVLVAAGKDLGIKVTWGSGGGPALTILTPLLSAIMIAWGAMTDRGRLAEGLRKLYAMSGRLPSDFMEGAGPGAAMVNAGVLGLASWGYLMAVGAELNGPTLGGVFTVIGFATFGKHLKNCLPVALGVAASTLVFGKSLTAPGPVLALLFGTTLAPLAGEFGPLVGFAAGFVHLMVVDRSAAWHGGLDLYNNGFAGGLTATLFVAVIEWYRSRPKD